MQNRFIIIKDKNKEDFLKNPIFWCEKFFAHGIIVYKIDKSQDITANIVNLDGSNGEFSGNGLRCLAKHIFDNYKSYSNDKILIKISGKIYKAYININNKHIICDFKLNNLNKSNKLLGEYISRDYIPGDYMPGDYMPGDYINVGNPHLLFSGYKSKQDFISWVKNKIQQDDGFSNFNISQYIKLDDKLYYLCTVERGVGPTPSCSSAALALCNLLKQKHKLLNIKNVTIQMPGGDLDVEFIQIKSDGPEGNHDMVSFSAPVNPDV